MSAKSCSNVFSSFPSLRATALLFRQPLPLFPRRAYCTTTSTFVSILDKRNPSGAGVFFFHTTSPSYSPLYGARLGSHGGRAGSHLSTRGMGGRLPLLADGCTGIMQQCRFLGNKVSGPQLDLFDPKSINETTAVAVHTRGHGRIKIRLTSSDLNRLKEEAKYVCRFFSQPALSYLDFKQGCCSLRVFLFLGLMGAVSLDLLLFHPPKSTYWNRFQVYRWPLIAERSLFPGKGDVFEYVKDGETVDPKSGAVHTEACRAFVELTYGGEKDKGAAQR